MFIKTVYAQGNAATLNGLDSVVQNFLRAVMGFVAIALFIMLVVGGFKYLTSGGNPEAAASGRRTITFAIAGVVLIAASYLILVIIQEITGADVTNFSIMGP